MPHLILVRHGKSAWNELGLWTGWTDVGLVEEGVKDALRAGQALSDIVVHKAYVSELARAKQTLAHIIEMLKCPDLAIESSPALNERHYGIYTGKNKWQVRDEVGEPRFHAIRRGWDTPIPEGESLKDVHARVVPFYKTRILPTMKEAKNALVVAHGNSLRALAKHLEGLNEQEVMELEIGTGEAHVYTLDAAGSVVAKEIRAADKAKEL